MTKANANLPAVTSMEPDEFTAVMIAAGFMSPPMGGSGINRIKVAGSNLMLGDDIIASYNAKTKEPALIVQLLDEPVQYQSMWFEAPLAMAVGRPNIADKYCRSHFDTPSEGRKYSEDGTSCDSCPVHPFMPNERLPEEALKQSGASKCSWKGDIEFRILEKQEDGTLAATDETVYTMTLATTGMIEFQGSNSKNGNPMAGSVSDENTKVRIAKLGLAKWGDQGILKAATYLRLGGVIAELRLIPASNKDKNYNYVVPSFNPIEILEVTEPAALPEGSPETTDADAVPF